MNHGHPVPLLELRHVSVTEGLSGRPLVQDVSFSLQRGHCLGIVGESGSGKSLLCRALLGLLPSGLVRSGQLHFDGRDLGRLDPAGWRELRGTGMAVILQQAMTAFDPLSPEQLPAPVVRRHAPTLHDRPDAGPAARAGGGR